MKPSFSFGKASKDVKEEFRLLEEMMNSEGKYNSMRYKQILLDLKSGDDIKILDAVSQLSTELSMLQEENLGGFQLDFLIPELVKCLQKEAIPEIMRSVLACISTYRKPQIFLVYAGISITQILDIAPQASTILVNSGGIEMLCLKMQNFEYVDVAENAVRALEKVSFDYAPGILNAGGFEIIVNMIDFFVATTQVRDS